MLRCGCCSLCHRCLFLFPLSRDRIQYWQCAHLQHLRLC
jgi:hypothetical protein